jgi:hypothetical protein
MSRVELKNVSTDDDGMLQMDVGASNGRTSARMELYACPADLQLFASVLEGFPASAESEVVWESGSADPKWFGHMRLRTHVLDGSGHSALEVLMDVRGTPPVTAMSKFSLRCNPADLNELGRRIKAWLANPSDPLTVEWRDA